MSFKKIAAACLAAAVVGTPTVAGVTALTLFTAPSSFAALAGVGYEAEITPATPTASSGTILLSNALAVPVDFTVQYDGVPQATYHIENGVGPQTKTVPFSGLGYGQVLTVWSSLDPIAPIKSWTRPAMTTQTIGLTSDPSLVTVPVGQVVTGATLTLTGISELESPAPATIQVAVGDNTLANVFQVSGSAVGGTATYSLAIPAGSRVLSASAAVATGWSGSFVLSSYQTVATEPVLAIPPQTPPVGDDQDGTANDTITVFSANDECWGNPMLNGVSYAPGTYLVAGIVDGKGNVTVSYPLAAHCALKSGAKTYSFPPIRFSEVTHTPQPPADTTETTKVLVCHATGKDDKFVPLETNVAALEREGHLTHQDGRDKISPYDTVKKGEEVSFPGRDWDQVFYDNGCEPVPGHSEPNPNPNPSEPVIPTPTDTDSPTPGADSGTTPPTQGTTDTTVTTPLTSSSTTTSTQRDADNSDDRDFLVDTAAAGQPLVASVVADQPQVASMADLGRGLLVVSGLLFAWLVVAAVRKRSAE